MNKEKQVTDAGATASVLLLIGLVLAILSFLCGIYHLILKPLF